MNEVVYWVGMFLIFAQIPVTLFEERFERLNISGGTRPTYKKYVWWQHPLFVIDPPLVWMLSRLIGKYHLDSFTWKSYVTLLVALVATRQALKAWAELNPKIRDHCSGTVAGLLHAVFFGAVVWFTLQIYLGLTTPVVNGRDLIGLSIFFTAFFLIGVVKFDWSWRWQRQDTVQTGTSIVLVWVATAVHIWWYGW